MSEETPLFSEPLMEYITEDKELIELLRKPEYEPLKQLFSRAFRFTNIDYRTKRKMMARAKLVIKAFKGSMPDWSLTRDKIIFFNSIINYLEALYSSSEEGFFMKTLVTSIRIEKTEEERKEKPKWRWF